MTLKELSIKSGVALATLSRIENGRMTGTIESHMNICRAMEISLPDLYRELDRSDKRVEIINRKTNSEVFVHSRHASSEMLASNVLKKKMMPVMIKIARLGHTHSEENKPGVEKFIYVLDGRIDAVIGGKSYPMSRNDTLYFDSSLPHQFYNKGAGEARVVCVTCPPAL